MNELNSRYGSISKVTLWYFSNYELWFKLVQRCGVEIPGSSDTTGWLLTEAFNCKSIKGRKEEIISLCTIEHFSFYRINTFDCMNSTKPFRNHLLFVLWVFRPIHLQQLEKVPFDMILHNDFFLRIVVFHSSFCCSTVSQAPFIVETVKNFHSDSNKK